MKGNNLKKLYADMKAKSDTEPRNKDIRTEYRKRFGHDISNTYIQVALGSYRKRNANAGQEDTSTRHYLKSIMYLCQQALEA